MSVTITNTSDALLPALSLIDGATYTIRVKNSGAATATVKLFLEGYDGKASEDCSNTEGKEIASEGWVYIRKLGDVAWNQISEPASYPAMFADLSSGCFVFTVAAGAYQDLELKCDVPASPETAGISHFSVVGMAAE